MVNSSLLNVCNDPSSSNITLSYWRIVHGGGGRVEAALTLLFIAVGLPWNILVVITILKQKLYKRPSNLILLNLAITDILLLLFTVPIYAATGITSEYFNLGKSDKVRCEFC